MRPKTKKRIIQLSAAAFLSLIIVFAYAVGLWHQAALTVVAVTADFEWNVSPPQTVSLYYPRWACGPYHPSWLLVEADPAAAAPLTVGKPVWLANDDHIDEVLAHLQVLDDSGERFFVECRGRFKSSLALLIREHGYRRWGGGCADDPLTGRVFEVEHCVPGKISPEQSRKINQWLNPV